MRWPSRIERITLDCSHLARSPSTRRAACWFFFTTQPRDVARVILRLQRGERVGVERGVPRLAFGDGALDALCVDSVSRSPSAKAWVRFVEVGPLPGGKRSGAGDVVGSAARHEDGLSAISIPGPTTLDGGWQVLFNFYDSSAGRLHVGGSVFFFTYSLPQI